MFNVKPVSILVAVLAFATLAAPDANAQARRGGGGGRVGGSVGRAVPRGVVPGTRVYAPRIVSPRIIGAVPYRPYYYPYRPGLTVGFYSGFGYGYPYYGSAYGYPYYGSGYGYPYYGSAYGYPYGRYGYALPPAGYVTAVPGYAYGGVRIEGAPEDAQVFADGYYVGVVDDFDGVFQHLNLQAGPHRLEIRDPRYPPIAFDVNVQPGQTITYHAGIQ
jgi:hypothetical protein